MLSMVRPNSLRYSLYQLGLCGLLLTMLSLSGCGGRNGEDVILDPLNLIDNFDKDPPRHHPRKLVEIGLGSFDIKMPTTDTFEVISVRFDAYIVVPKEARGELEERVQQRSSRIHDFVNRVMHNIDPKELSDPNMTWMKSELIPVMNRVLQSDDVRDVVFADFSVSVG